MNEIREILYHNLLAFLTSSALLWMAANAVLGTAPPQLPAWRNVPRATSTSNPNRPGWAEREVMSVRAKFTVTSIRKNFYKNHQTGEVVSTAAQITLAPQYDTSIEEDRRFSKATPSGEISLHIDNPPAVEFFAPGKVVYVDFTSAE